MFIFFLIKPGHLPAGYFEELEAEDLANRTGAPIILTRLIVEADIENNELTDGEIFEQRVQITLYILRVLNLYVLSRSRGNF